MQNAKISCSTFISDTSVKPAQDIALSMLHPPHASGLPPSERVLHQSKHNLCSQVEKEGLVLRVGQEPAFRRLLFNQVLLSGCFHRLARRLGYTWARQMIKNKALTALRGMGDEGITLSPSSQLLSAQLWYRGREKVVQTPLDGAFAHFQRCWQVSQQAALRGSHTIRNQKKV